MKYSRNTVQCLGSRGQGLGGSGSGGLGFRGFRVRSTWTPKEGDIMDQKH